MKSQYQNYKTIKLGFGHFVGVLLGITIFVFVLCTSNPIFEDVDPSAQEIVKGKVRLNDDESPEGIFVWFEGLNISTYTDEAGDFTIQLPPPPSQPGGGLTGNYRLFYYVGNYGVTTSSIVIRNGRVVYGTADVDSEGNINETVVLNKLIDVETVVDPPIIHRFDSVRIEISVILTPHVSNVPIASLKEPDGFFNGLFFRKKGTPIEDVAFLPITGSPRIEMVTSRQVWLAGVYTFWLGLELFRAEFEVIPFLIIIQDNCPDALIESISEKATTYHYEYLKIPFRRKVGSLTVR